MKSFRLSAVLLLVVLFAVPASATEVTVGTFVERLAQSKNLDATDARIAVRQLRDAGIHLPSDLVLSDRLTEGDVARISRALGLNVSTNRPGAGFSGEQMDVFFASYQVERALAADTSLDGVRSTGSGPPFNPYAKGKGGGKGKKRGHYVVPSDPE